ncbi:MAG: helix-turn-helix transcriptional regulator [Nanoarchaeota archaeon]|nr:helix-turn-helix transcriptional regulator [Nanoarchaeota archaeon]
MNKHHKKNINFQKYLEQQLKNPEFRKHYEEFGKHLEIAYEIQRLRKEQGVSQAVLARKIGTQQSNIARMEAGEQNFTTETLRKIAKALDRDLKIEFVK